MKRHSKKKSAVPSQPKSGSEAKSKPLIPTREKPIYIDESVQPFGVEEGYGSEEDLELMGEYKSPLTEAASYHSYLTIVPDDGEDEEDAPRPGEENLNVSYEEPLSSPDSTPLYDNSPASTPSDLPSPGMEIEQDEAEREKLRLELAEVESDILTLKQTLRAKEAYSKDIKRKLGITPINQMKEGFQHGWQNFQQSTAYNKTKSGLTTAGQKTTSAFNTFGTAVSKRLGDMRDSNTFKSFEEKVSSATTSIRTKVAGPKTQESSFEEVLQSTANAEQQQDANTNSALETEEKVPL